MVATAVRHPISRWYLLPTARAAAAALSQWTVTRAKLRPAHITLAGLCFSLLAAAILLRLPHAAPAAAFCVLAAWFCDRVDGLYARLTGQATAWGAWLDANVDELSDVGLQAAVAAAAAAAAASQLPWLCFAGFLAGKYLFVFSLRCDETIEEKQENSLHKKTAPAPPGLWRRLYHLPGDADVRVHLLIFALLTGYLTTELALLAAYYNLRWIARYPLAARRLGGCS